MKVRNTAGLCPAVVYFYLNKYSNTEEINKIRIKTRNELHIQQNKKLVMFSAVFKRNKGLSDFLRLAQNYANNSNYLFLLVGDGEEAGLIDKFNLSNIIWLGFVNNVEDYLLASDIYIFTSLFEMMPVALIEAINCDRAILAYNTQINNFLLNSKNICNTFNELSDKLAEHQFVKNHKKYDKKYGMEKLRDLLK